MTSFFFFFGWNQPVDRMVGSHIHCFVAVATAENGLRALEYLGLSDDQQTSHKPTVCNFLFSHFPISDKRFIIELLPLGTCSIYTVVNI